MGRGEAERNQESLIRRRAVLALPVVPLRLHGWLLPSEQDPGWRREPEAVGIGPDGCAWAFWRPFDEPQSALVTTHFGGHDISASRELSQAPGPAQHFIQPLPGDRVLTASARSSGGPNGYVWNSDGVMARQADMGDAIGHMVSDDAGDVWVGYFDEALGAPPPAGRGLARFCSDLTVEWMYPATASTSLPPIYDCYGLNIDGRSAYCYAYDRFELVSVTDGEATTFGAVPYNGASNLVVGGNVGAMIGGYGPDYDLITPFRVTPTGIELSGSAARIVMPDGLEVRDRRVFCRGSELHVVVRTGWYRLDLEDLLTPSR